MRRKRLFIPPNIADYGSSGQSQYLGYENYAHYNYLRGGVIAAIKQRHFEHALQLGKAGTSGNNVIDFGCADGVLLPSLSAYYRRCAGIDQDLNQLEAARRLVENTGLSNVNLIASQDLTWPEILGSLGNVTYDTMFLLELLEHIGDRGRPYESRTEFLHNLFTLLAPGGVIIASVPKMIGVTFMTKYAVQRLLGMHVENHSLPELWQAGIMRNTDRTERVWRHGHKGFNHARLERYLRRDFHVIATKNTLISRLYVVRERR